MAESQSTIEILKKIEPGDENHGSQELINFIKAVKNVDIDVVSKMFDGFDSSKFDQYGYMWEREFWKTWFVQAVWIVCALTMSTPQLFPVIAPNLIKFRKVTIIKRSENYRARIYYFRIEYCDGSIDESKFFINEADEDEKLFLDSGFIKEKHWFFWDKFTFYSHQAMD